jgi:hypothetical protein
MRYKQKAFGLLRELERGPEVVTELKVAGDRITVDLNIVPQLVKRIQRKELDSKNLARYAPDVLWPEGPYAKQAFTLRSKDLAMEAAKAKEEDYSGLFKCGKCKGVKTTYYQMQTRSADEPMVSSLLLFLSYLSFVLMHPLYRLLSSLAPPATTAGSVERHILLTNCLRSG